VHEEQDQLQLPPRLEIPVTVSADSFYYGLVFH